MLDKLKFLGLVWGMVILSYLMITVMMPFFSTMATSASDEVEASPNAATYVGAAEAADYAPLFVYFVPAIAGVGFTVWKLRQK